VTTLLLTVALALAIAVPMHWWPRLGAPARRRLSLATSLAGLGFLVAALRSEGQRETALTSIVLVGPATATAHATAGASLYYYVLTGFCLLLGFAGLSVSDRLAGWLRPRVLLTSAAVGWLATVVRALLEKSAAPTLLVDAVGVTWLAPVAGAYMAIAFEPRRSGPAALVPDLLRYAYLVRVPVAAVGIVATRLAAGTHYDVSPLTDVAVAFSERGFSFAPGSWSQLFWLTLLPQLLIWPVFTVLVGALGGALGFLLVPPPVREGAEKRGEAGQAAGVELPLGPGADEGAGGGD
jgi:hypothetical protein